MLANGPYPQFLKTRIRSDQGHLSNPDAAEALERLASARLRRVLALHRSSTNNSPTIDVARQDLPLDSAPPQGALFSVEQDAS
jgi:phosphoribosyl 1,2-cyclic phosphodiesterase